MRRNKPDPRVSERIAENAAKTGVACFVCGTPLDVPARRYATSRWNENVRLCAQHGNEEALAKRDIFRTSAVPVDRFDLNERKRREDDWPDDETGEGVDGHTYSTFRGKSVGPFRGDY